MYECNFSKELVTILSQPFFYDSFKLVIIPQINSDGKNFEVFQKGNQIEVICYKSTLISIFKENHKFIEKYLPDLNFNTIVGNTTKVNYIDFYNVTVGLLLTTAENKTNFNLHSDVFFIIWNNIKYEDEKFEFLLKETFIIQRLLTCSLNKINKSSSLYIWYRKLFILWQHIHNQHYNKNIEKLIFNSKIFIQSGKQHFANYYCWNTAKWIFDNLNSLTLKQAYFNDIKLYCLQNISDSSSWDCLSYMVCQHKLRNNHHRTDFDRLAKHLPILEQLSTRNVVCFQPNLISLTQELISYISKCEIKMWPPYLCLLRILKVYNVELNNLRLELIDKWTKSIKTFESKNGQIQLLHNFIPIVSLPKDNNSDLNNDFIMKETLLHLGYKKVFLNNLINHK